MPGTFVQVPTDGAGKKLAAKTWTDTGDTVYGQKLIVCDANGNEVTVTSNRLVVDGSGVTQPVSNPGTFAVQDSQKVVDNAAFTDGTTPVQPMGYIFDEAAGTALTENDAGAARIDSKRSQVSVIEDETTRGRRATVTAANALKVDASGVAVNVLGNAPTASTSTLTSGSTVTSSVAVAGYSGVGVMFSGTYAAFTIVFEVSLDAGTTWIPTVATHFGLALGMIETASRNLGGNATEGWSITLPPGTTHVRVNTFGGVGPASGTCNVRFTPGVFKVSNALLARVEQMSTAAVLVDATANPTVGLVGTSPSTFNGTTWDRTRGNMDGTGLASAARTATTASSDIVNYNARGVHLILNVTSAGTGSIQANIQAKDPISGNYYKLAVDPTAVTTAATFVYEYYPGAGTAAAGGITVRTQCSLPRTWRVVVTHGNANTITYSVGYSLLL